jgi:HTH-type transcriptional repressor of NAD biosynthesis genes
VFEHAVIATKGWPLHRGHERLINEARRQSRKVTVLLVWGEGQSPVGEVRAQWLKDTFPDIKVKLVADIFVDDTNPEDSKLWAVYTKDIMQGDEFDVVFTSEPYGPRWAKLMNVECVQVDTRRTIVPISGTAIRQDPYLHWQYINAEARLTYLKRVLVVGAESTGKTTLCQKLANLYSTFYVPEFGRYYVEQFENFEDLTDLHKRVIFGNIINRQPELEREIEREARLVCFYDTDLFTTALWYEQWQSARIGDRLHKTLLQASEYGDSYDLVLVSSHESANWVDDGYRDQTEDIRAQFTERLLTHFGGRAILLEGSWNEREAVAIDYINNLFLGSHVTLPVSKFDYVSSKEISWKASTTKLS